MKCTRYTAADVRLLFIGENSHSTFGTRHRYNVMRNGEFRTRGFGGLIDYVRRDVI